MNNHVNETQLMEMIWRELEAMRRVRAANEYYSYLASMQFAGPTVDKLYANTYDYLVAMSVSEGTEPEVVMEQAVKDSLQAHIAHFIDKTPHLMNSFSPAEIAGLKNYAMRKIMVDSLINSVQEIIVQSAPKPGEKDVRGKRRRRSGSSTQYDNSEVAEQSVPESSDRRRRRRPGVDIHAPKPVVEAPKRAKLRESVKVNGTSVTPVKSIETKPVEQPASVAPQKVSAPVPNHSVIIKRLEGQPMEYQHHQTVKIFDTAKQPADRPKEFEGQLRMAPIVRPVIPKNIDEPTTIEVLNVGDEEVKYDAIPLLQSESPLMFSIASACLTARSEIRNSEFNSPGRQTGIVEFEVVTPIQYFTNPISAEIAINEHYLHPLINYADQNEFGLVEWHARLEHAIEMSDSSMATALLAQLDRLATIEFNGFLKYTLGLSSSVDSFVGDFLDFYKAVSESMTVPVLDALLGEMVDGVRQDDVAGSMLIKRIANIRVMKKSDISKRSDEADDEGVVLCMVRPVSVLVLGANSSELHFATTSEDYNSITTQSSKDEPHVISGILRMFTAALVSRKESMVYLVTEDNEMFHIRDMTRIENGTPVLHLGIKYLNNLFTTV